MDSSGAAERAPDFFISRAGADAAFAAKIGRILEGEGHIVVLQQWDFANRNFIECMHAALESGARVIALLSNDTSRATIARRSGRTRSRTTL